MLRPEDDPTLGRNVVRKNVRKNIKFLYIFYFRFKRHNGMTLLALLVIIYLGFQLLGSIVAES